MKPIALYYLSFLDDIRALARGLGYAVALHGTLGRDFDLVAIPWAEEAKPAAELAEAVRALVGGHIAVNQLNDPDGGMTRKPHGRMAWSIHFPYQPETFKAAGGCAYIDLSVMPRSQDGPEVQRLKRGAFTKTEEE